MNVRWTAGYECTCLVNDRGRYGCIVHRTGDGPYTELREGVLAEIDLIPPGCYGRRHAVHVTINREAVPWIPDRERAHYHRPPEGVAAA